MALTAQMDILGQDGTISGIGAIDPDLWAANKDALNAFAAKNGVSLIFYDTIGQYEAEFNIHTLQEAEAYIVHYATLVYAKSPVTPPSSSDGEVAGALVAAAAVGTVLWLLTR